MTLRRACVLAILIGIGASCCLFDIDEPVVISGRLTSDFGCYLLWDDRTYELHRWEDPIPPLGSRVTLRVRPIHDAASVCMAGKMVDVLAVIDVRTDFRTDAVVGEETWGPEDEIVLGQVEVSPGGVLTVLPGTLVQIITEGELHVRGRITMEGSPGDSVRIDGVLSPRGGRLLPGPVVLDSVAAGSRLRFVTTRTGFHVRGDAPVLENILGGISVNHGTATIRDSHLSAVSGQDAGIVLEESHVEYIVDGVHTSFTLKGNVLPGLILSYSRASATKNEFGGRRVRVLFHGASGGTFERNAFDADSTHIEVRHNSNPVFQQNNFVSRGMAVECNSHSGPCIQFANNWWGTTDEAAIRARFRGPCTFCYSPWLSAPVPW